MPKKKKAFINKKTASTYHLVRRSQRDVGYLDDDENNSNNETDANNALSQFVLMPSPNNKQEYSKPIELDTFDARFSKKKQANNTNDNDEEEKGSGSVMKILGNKLAQVGLTESNYDYSQHLLPIDGSGAFLSAGNGKRMDPTLDPRSKLVQLDEDVEDEEIYQKNEQQRKPRSNLEQSLGSFIGGGVEIERNLESIALTPDCMDDDMAHALFGDLEEGNFEEILDDFVLTAAQEEDIIDDNEEMASAAFDYDEHIRKLIEKAQAQENGGGNSHQFKINEQDDFFANAKPLSSKRNEEGEEYNAYDQDDHDIFEEEFGLNANIPGVAPALSPDEEKALCEKFELTLLEYDSDNVGDLDNECEEIMGDLPLEGDAQIEAAFDNFLEEKRDNVFMEGTRHLPEKQRKGGSSYSALIGTTMVPANKLYEEEQKITDNNNNANAIPTEVAIQQVLNEADQILANPEMEPPEEDVLIDGKSYFSQSVLNPWDCESILTTYSNLDNNPTTIGRSSRRKNKGKNKNKADIQPVQEDADYVEYQEIQLSNKTGLPMGVLPTKEKQDYDNDDVVNKGTARKKTETKQEKNLRKMAVKEERMISRMQKKMVKEAFKDEFMKRSMDGVVNEVGGKSVFKYS